jgi:hypothetical protein
MLISQTKYSAGDIVTFKLVNGDEIIAEVTDSTMAGWTVKRPCTVVPSQQGIGLLQSMFTANLDASIELNKQHVMLHAETMQELRSHYIRTTTGIETPAKQGIIR